MDLENSETVLNLSSFELDSTALLTVAAILCSGAWKPVPFAKLRLVAQVTPSYLSPSPRCPVRVYTVNSGPTVNWDCWLMKWSIANVLGLRGLSSMFDPMYILPHAMLVLDIAEFNLLVYVFIRFFFF